MGEESSVQAKEQVCCVLCAPPATAPLTFHREAHEQLPEPHGVLGLADVAAAVAALGAVLDGEPGHVPLLADEEPPPGLDLHLGLPDVPQPAEPSCRCALGHPAGQGHVVTHKAGLRGIRFQGREF